MNSDCSNGLVCDGILRHCRVKSNNTDNTFCAEGGILCTVGEGGCKTNLECQGSLICGTDNCPDGTSNMDCCSGKENRKNFCCFDQGR